MSISKETEKNIHDLIKKELIDDITIAMCNKPNTLKRVIRSVDRNSTFDTVAMQCTIAHYAIVELVKKGRILIKHKDRGR